MPPRALTLREGKAPVRDRLFTMLFLAALQDIPGEVVEAAPDAPRWKVGDRVPLTTNVPAKNGSRVWTFDILAIADNTDYPDMLWMTGKDDPQAGVEQSIQLGLGRCVAFETLHGARDHMGEGWR